VSNQSTASPGAIANSGALILLAIYLAVVIWKGKTPDLWKGLSGEGGFLKWAAAAWAVRVLTQFQSVQPVGNAIWGLAVLAFLYQILLKSKGEK